MKKGTLWLLTSLMIVSALVLSCTTATEEEVAGEEEEVAGEEEEVAGEEEEVAGEEEEVSSDEPRYGGVMRNMLDADLRTFDDCYIWSSSSWSWSVNITNEELIAGDWSRGPAGTNEVTWLLYTGWDGMEQFETGSGWSGLAESWEIDVENTQFIYHIRQGVHFHDKAPANGRELTAEDVVYNINRQWSTPQSFLHNSHYPPELVSAPDKWTVIVRFDTISAVNSNILQVGDLVHMYPPEAIEQFGDMMDWRNSIGTGPFMLTDYLKGSSATFIKNPNYWGKYPVQGPAYGKQVPFVDGLKVLIIPDLSTRMAAMRTGKADWGLFGWEDRASLKKTNPELMDTYFLSTDGFIHMRQDDPNLPWHDKNVRRALHMAVDYQAIADDFYGGEAKVFQRVIPMEEYSDMIVPFNELPASVQELYVYNPDKAKQMLADAGYADGFDAELVCRTTDVDLLSIYKDYWAKIGVNLILDPKETAVWSGIRSSKSEKHMIFSSASTALTFNFGIYRTISGTNVGKIDDERVNKVYDEVWSNYQDWDKATAIFRDSMKWILDEAWHIPTPAYKRYSMWQPWVKGYHGEISLGNSDLNTFAEWIWIDQDLKEAMIGSR